MNWRKALIAIGILIVIGGITALEYSLFPNRVERFENPNTDSETSDEQDSSNTVRIDVPLSQISVKNFELAGISNIERRNNSASNHLFGIIRLDVEDDNMAVVKTDFFKIESDVIFIRIYEVFPVNETTIAKAFLSIKEKFEDAFRNDPESNVNQTDRFGHHSFYVNPISAPEKVFLVAVTEDHLIGFEYLKEKEPQVLPLIEHLVPSLKEEKVEFSTGSE